MDPLRPDSLRPTDPLRIGVLGAARIAPPALLSPASRSGEARVVAVAARDPARARTFAAKHRIPEHRAYYEALIEDPEIDAIYNPLPNGLHGLWTLAAIAAGKHVLCEKPFTANAEEAQVVADAARASGLVVMEAFHYRYHPLAERLRTVVAGGEIGRVRRIEIDFCAPLAKRGDIRYRLDLAGGAMMDMGCYTVHLLRLLAGGEPEVQWAKAWRSSPSVDRAMKAELALPDGGTGRLHCSMLSSSLLRMHARVEGEQGEVSVFNPFAPQFFNRVTVRTPTGRRVEHLTREPTYDFQLRAFVAAVRHGAPVLTPPEDAVANMTVIDNLYRAAGLGPRRPSTWAAG